MREPRPLHAPVRTHLREISDATGIFQHAVGRVADPAHGHCTDDVARSLQVDLLQARRLGWAAVADSAWANLCFLEAAHAVDGVRFRNFRAVDGTWLDEPGSDDCQGRAIHALGDAAVAPFDAGHAARSGILFRAALSRSRGLAAPRARASVILGCAAVMRAGAPTSVAATYRQLATRLAASLETDLEHRPVGRGDAAWPWPEPRLTYENALLPRALIVAGLDLRLARMLARGLAMLDWLIDVQTEPDGHLSPVGNGWWAADGSRSRFDQQPIEPASLLLAAEAALRATGNPRYRDAMEGAYAWFLGFNDLGLAVADPARGACHDGLTPTGVNLNQGAESTLVWLGTVERIAALRAGDEAAAVSAVRQRPGAVPAAHDRRPRGPTVTLRDLPAARA